MIEDGSEEIAGLLEGLDPALIIPHLQRVAAEVLTDRQREIVMRRLSGDSLAEIGRALSVSRQTIDQQLRGVDGGGALPKLRRALLVDEGFANEVNRQRAGGIVDDSPSHAITQWYIGLRPSTLSHFVPRAVLLVLWALRDTRGDVSYQTARQHLPSQTLTLTLPLLRTLGYVESDGITIRIKKTPLDERQ